MIGDHVQLDQEVPLRQRDRTRHEKVDNRDSRQGVINKWGPH
jgi:hypothetical protein